MNKAVEKLRKKFLKNPSAENEKSLKEKRQTYNRALRNAKEKHYEDQIEKAGKDSKQVWKTINELLQRGKGQNEKETITVQGQEISDKKDISNIFSHYYQTAATKKLKGRKPKANFREFLPPKDKRTNQFQLKEIDNIQTWKIIKTLSSKRSSGHDRISPRLVKACATNLSPPLTLIINKCFQSGDFPKRLKLAKLTPIHKKGEREPGNFRPISQLSTFSKIIEKSAHAQLRTYLQETFEDKHQFAYKPAHSTVHPIILTRQIIEEHLHNNHYVLLTLIDLSLAFDCIETGTTLPGKLLHYGATDLTTNFFRNFFTDRQHLTEWFGETSEVLNLDNYSCVQGSCLGAPIFNLYTMDLQGITNSQLINFADDTNMITANKCPLKLIETANNDLKKISTYMSANSLLINPKKTQAILLKPKNKPAIDIQNQLTLDDQPIEIVKNARYLGVTFDSQLNFKAQFNSVLKKLTTATKALLVTRKLLNKRAKMKIYNGLFKSNLEYAFAAYGDKLTLKQRNQISILQKRAIRIIHKAKPGVHTNQLFQISKILPANDTLNSESIKLIFKLTNEITKTKQPKALCELFSNKSNTRQTRLSQTTDKINMNSKTPGTLVYRLSKNWNEADQETRNMGNYAILKKCLKNTVLNNLTPCSVKQCKICLKDKNVNYNQSP